MKIDSVTRAVREEIQRRTRILRAASLKVHAEYGCTNWQTKKNAAKRREANSQAISDRLAPFAFTSESVRRDIVKGV